MGEPVKSVLTNRWQKTETHPGKSAANPGYVATDFFQIGQKGNPPPSQASPFGKPGLRRSAPPSAHTLGYSRNLEYPDFPNLASRSQVLVPRWQRPQAIDEFIDSLQVVPESLKRPEPQGILVEIPPEKTGLAKAWASLTDPLYQFTRKPFVNSVFGLGSILAGQQYPWQNSAGPVTYVSTVTNFLPSAVRIGVSPYTVTFAGSLKEITFEKEAPIETFHRTGGYFVGLMEDDMPLSADQFADSGYFAKQDDKTRHFMSQIIYAQMGIFFASVRMGHYVGSPKFHSDILADSLLNHTVLTYTDDRIEPTYSRPFFNDHYLSVSADWGQVLGFGTGVKASWQYIGWDGDIENPQTGEPIKRLWFWVDMHHTVGG